MEEDTVFDYEMFLRLNSLDLADYMEPLLASPSTRVPDEVLTLLLSGLSKFDEYHLVYALQLSANVAIAACLSHVPQYLVHEQDSVRCTAFNILNQLSSRQVTEELIESVESIHSSNPDGKFVNNLLEKWGNTGS